MGSEFVLESAPFGTSDYDEGSATMQIRVIGVPCVEATPSVRGKAAGLELATDAYLGGGLVERIGSLGIEVTGVERLALPPERISGDPIVNLGRYNQLVGKAVAGAIESGSLPLLAGGTCSHLIGMLAGLQQAHTPETRIGLIWLDAHGDFNTPATSLSGMLGGMPVAVSAGLCLAAWRERAGMTAPLPTNRIVMVDVRNLDKKEADLIEATDVTVAKFAAGWKIDGIATAIQQLADRVDLLYLHVDSDILDATLQPNHPTAEPDGPDVRAVLAVLRSAFATSKVGAFAVVSVNPSSPGGEISLATGFEMLLGGVSLWSEFTHA
jgi:arginase